MLAAPLLAESPRVVTDIGPVQSLVANVLGEAAPPPPVLVAPGASPHGAALKPSQARALQEADLVIWIGPGLTPWLTKPVSALTGEARELRLMEVDGTRHYALRGDDGHGHGEDHGDEHGAEHHDNEHHDNEHHDDEHHDDADHGADHDENHDKNHDGARHDEDHHDEDHHDGGHEAHDHAREGEEAENDDPHAWLDITNAQIWLGAIAEALAASDPQNAEAYVARADAASAALMALDQQIAARFEPLAEVSFVTYHDGFQYFERRYGLHSAGSIAPSDASAPGPAWLSHMREEMREMAVKCVLTEPQYPARLTEVVADGASVNLGVLDPLGSALTPGAQMYPAMMWDLAEALATCLEASGQ